MSKFNKKDIVLSAKFKKDYVTFLAIAIFVIMIICELCVAISIPILVRYSNIYAEEGIRHNLIDKFDKTRALVGQAKKNNNSPKAKADIEFIQADLDRIALDLRLKQIDMDIHNAEELLGYINQYYAILSSFNEKEQDSLIKQLDVNVDDNLYDLIEKIDSLEDKKVDNE